MIILGIESSCDETAAAVVKDGRTVLSSLISSQIETHLPFGGVIPEIAAREHLRVIDTLTKNALAEAKMTIHDVDAIAVTRGPGLIGALLVGVSYAKGLAVSTGKPLIPVDHVHAHIHGGLLGIKDDFADVFPCLAMVVSGGHTNLYFMKHSLDFTLIARSLDDACGECFDKVAKLYGFDYPGGPIIERLAKHGDPSRFSMPVMVENKQRLAFSYSGLKTHMLHLHRKMSQPISSSDLADVMAAFQEAALGQIVRKVKYAHQHYQAKSVLISGGVASNQALRDMLTKELPCRLLFPELRFCSDNAAMIAACGYHHTKSDGGATAIQTIDWDAYSRYDFSPH